MLAKQRLRPLPRPQGSPKPSPVVNLSKFVIFRDTGAQP
jgi:hypothetical protein